jgi:ATP-binding cassette subfamily F protein uup
LEAIPGEIAALEAEQRALTAKMSDPEYYRQPPEQLRADQRRIGEIETLLMQKLERWEALEAPRAGPPR